MDYYPKKIICLTEEPTEILYMLGEEKRIVGISGFTVRPRRAKKENPIICSFIEVNLKKIKELDPDLIIGFSDIQSEIAKQLIKEGYTVLINNHRSVKGILNVIIQIGSLIGKIEKSYEIIREYKKRLDEIQEEVNKWKNKPTVYFEEWYDPIITAIKWVAEIIELAGGNYIFTSFSNQSLATNRIINANLVVKKNPDIILISWCGKKFKPEKFKTREGWEKIKAIKTKQIFEIKSSIILQPGPAAIFEGLKQIHEIFKKWNINE